MTVRRCLISLLAWAPLSLGVLCAGAAPAGATQYAYVEIFCNNYPEYDRDGTLLNGDRDGKVPPNCTYYSNVIVAHYYRDVGDSASGAGNDEARDEQRRIEERAREAFALERQPCQSMRIQVVAGCASFAEAEERRHKFLDGHERRGDCAKSFQLFY